MGLDAAPPGLDPRVERSQQDWRATRQGLNGHRHGLTAAAARLYEPQARLHSTGLLTRDWWMPSEPVELTSIGLELGPAAAPAVSGAEAQAAGSLPLASLEQRYRRYSHAVRDLDPPRLFENRLSFRLLDLDWPAPGSGRMLFGHTTYFEMVDVCELLAHEAAAAHIRPGEAGPAVGQPSWRRLAFRKLVADPFDLARRPVLPSVNTLTVRHSRSGSPSLVLHRRDPASVAVAGGMLHVMPAGVFQPSSVLPAAQAADFDLWRNVMREYSEEFLGNPEHGGDGAPIDYDMAEPFRSLKRGRRAGQLRVYCLGLALDALTLAGEILTVAVIDAGLYDDVFADLVQANTEGTVAATSVPFEEHTVRRLLTRPPPRPRPGRRRLHRAGLAAPASPTRPVGAAGVRVLVTGGLGFTGQALTRTLLEHDHQVLALTHRPGPWPTAPAGARVAQADIRDPSALARVVAGFQPEGVCHLAALTRVRDSFTDPVGYFDVNVGGTTQLLAALGGSARRTGRPARLVFASTGAVYGARDGQLGEDQPCQPQNPYSAAKLAAEQLVGYQAATGRLAATSLRCFNVAGAVAGIGDPDTSRVIPKAIAVAAGTAERLQVNGDGTAVRDFTHVADVADAYRLALEAAQPGKHRIYNLGSNRETSVTDIIDTVRQLTARPVPVEHLPPKSEPRMLTADSRRIQEELGWTPHRSNLEQIVHDAWAALPQGWRGERAR